MPFMSAIDMLSFQVINDIDKDMIIIHTQDKIKDSVFQFGTTPSDPVYLM